jgi:hypothetical protein
MSLFITPDEVQHIDALRAWFMTQDLKIGIVERLSTRMAQASGHWSRNQ